MSPKKNAPKSPKSPKSPKYNAKKLSGKRNDTMITYVLGGVAIVAIVLLIVFFVVLPNMKDSEVQAEGYGSVQAGTPVKVINDGTVQLGDPATAAATIDAYEDFMCPACASFELQYGNAVNKAIDSNGLAVRYHMLNFLNRNSASGDYSSRAAGAALCVAETGDGELFSKFHSTLFQTGADGGDRIQPKEGSSSDLSNGQLADLAKQVGADDSVVACINGGDKVTDAEQGAQSSMTQLNDAVGKVSTPSILHDGKKVDVFQNTNWISDLTKQ